MELPYNTTIISNDLRRGTSREADEMIVALTRENLLRVDALLPRFFHREHVGIRYT
jgi:hypothetical protein